MKIEELLINVPTVIGNEETLLQFSWMYEADASEPLENRFRISQFLTNYRYYMHSDISNGIIVLVKSLRLRSLNIPGISEEKWRWYMFSSSLFPEPVSIILIVSVIHLYEGVLWCLFGLLYAPCILIYTINSHLNIQHLYIRDRPV